MRRLTVLVWATLATLGVAPAAAAAEARVAADFNGDGHDDLAVGVPGEDLGTVADAGAVNVIYGTRRGLAPLGNQFLHQDAADIGGAAETLDNFGTALAAGDFDFDGYDDLAVGVPGEDVIAVPNDEGAVNVLYGSASGLSGERDQVWVQGGGVLDTPEPHDHFGQTLAAGNFNLSGPDDLAIGVPDEGFGSAIRVGAVNVLYGSAANGLGAGNDQLWHQSNPGIDDDAEANDRFGASLATGDFDGGGSDDLAVGVPLEDLDGLIDAGAVTVIDGSALGLAGTLSEDLWSQDRPGVAEVTEQQDRYGSRLASGDFDASGQDDLVIGAPEGVGQVSLGGMANVLYGSSSGLSAAGDQLWHQDASGIADRAENGDAFADSLVTADLNGDGWDDLALGVPVERLGASALAGCIHIIYGSAARLRASGSRLWHQDSVGIADAVEEGDGFGAMLTSGDFDGNGQDDLGVGVLRESFDAAGVSEPGAVHTLYGSLSGANGARDRLWHQDIPGVADAAEAFDWFGSGLPQ